MERINVDLAQGGTAVLIAPSPDYQIPEEFRFHPQVMRLAYDELSGDASAINDKLPATTKVVVTAERVPQSVYNALQSVIRRRTGLLHIHRQNPVAVADALFKLFTKNGDAKDTTKDTPDDPDNPKAPRGAIQALLAQADLSKGSAEEARRLFAIAQAQGTPTTLGSLAQGISVRKRKASRGETPNSVRTPQLQALLVLDQAIDGLKLIREFVNDTETENAGLKARLRKIEEAIGITASGRGTS